MSPSGRGVRALLMGLGAAAAVIGCSLEGTLAPNQEPETTLWVSGELDTVKHTAHFFWDGQDVDGVVTGFEFKFIFQPGAEPAGYDSTVWFFTADTDSLFVVFAPSGVDFPSFVIRAIDDQGARDPTPARQQFKLSNQAPSVVFTVFPSDTTFPVATLGWMASDPDGNINNASYRVWIEGKEDQAEIITGTTHSFLPALFEDASGVLVAGPRKAFVTAIDDGGRMSLPDSFVWFVKLPLGSVLLVDDLPSSVPGASTFDSFYRGVFDTRLGAGTYTTLDLEQGSPFRSQADVRETFLFFDDVFWYSEINPDLSPSLALIEDGIRSQLDAGKDIYISSTRLVGTDGALGDLFVQEVLGATRLHMNNHGLPFSLDLESNFSLKNGSFFVGGTPPFDSLKSAGLFGGVEALDLADPSEAAYLAVPGALDTLPTALWPVGVNRRVGSGQGRLVFLAFPIRVMNGAFSGQPGRAAIELNRIFDQFNIP